MRRQEGQALLEILLAFSILMVVLSAVMFGVTAALNNAQYAKNQNLANSYAKEGMAVIRKIRDSGWVGFPEHDDDSESIKYCINESLGLDKIPFLENCLRTESETESETEEERIFSREVIFEHESSSCCSDTSPNCSTGTKGNKATVKVSWTDSRCPIGTGKPLCHSVELITCFSDIDLKQAP